jgi:hypothetical protein
LDKVAFGGLQGVAPWAAVGVNREAGNAEQDLFPVTPALAETEERLARLVKKPR